jgi:hypothetical protein
MKRLLIVTFALFYTTSIVALTAAHTFTWAGGFADAAKPQPMAKRMHSPHSSETKFVEQQFVVERLHVVAPLIVVARTTHSRSLDQLPDSSTRFILSRAPPAKS